VNDSFSLSRLVQLVRNDLERNYRAVLIVSATLALLTVIGPLGLVYTRTTTVGFYRFFFIGALFAWGTMATSLAFRDLHGRSTNAAFLLLPATAFEKMLARLLVGTVFLIVYLLLLTSVLSLLGESLELVGRGGNEWFSPFDGMAWMLIPHYLIVQSVFFLGAAWFRKMHYVKTLLAVALIVTGLSAVYAGMGWLGWATWRGAGINVDTDDGFYGPMRWLFELAKAGYFVGLPLFCWYVTWLRVKETQVSHGV
jgi:hypothetical protein